MGLKLQETEEMVYIVGLIGFIGGFVLGQFCLAHWLRHHSNDDILSDSGIMWTYGLFNWLIAAIGCYSSVQLYTYYFG